MSTSDPKELELLKELYPDAEIVKGTELFRGLMNRRVTKNMLHNGVAIIESCRVTGETMDASAKPRIVVYDRDYAIKLLLRTHKTLINELCYAEWTHLMSDLYYEGKKDE